MKKKLFQLCFIVSVICFFSCHKNSPPNKDNFRVWLNPDVRLADVFSMSLNLKVRFDDQFKLYYTENNTFDFNEEMTITTKVIGIDSNQKITFRFPKNIHPTNIRLDLGVNKNQEVFILDTINLKFGTNQFKIPPSYFLEYFETNRQIRYDSINHSLKVIRQNNLKNYRPLIKSKENLFLEIEKLINIK